MAEQSTSGAPVPPPPPPPSLALGENRASGTAENYDATIVYIDLFLKSRSYPTFLNLTEMHITGDHLRHYLECTWNYIAITRFVWGKDKVTGEDKVLGKATKLKHIDQVKAVFKQKFRSHELWNDDKFFTDCKKVV